MRADINVASSLFPALEHHDVAYYLVHSLAGDDFAEKDRAGAHAFAHAALEAKVTQVIYLGGLGDDREDLSEHLRSRREVEHILMDSVPTTALRAGIVIGDGSISWEILRQLVTRLPVMITPRWVETRTQPIALADALFVLIGVLGKPGNDRPELRNRRSRASDLSPNDVDGQSHHGSSAGHRARAAAVPKIVVALVAIDH